MEKLTQKIMILITLMVLLSIGVNAFAVSMPYMKDKTLIMYPGGSTEFTVGLQNMVGDSDQTVMVTINEGSEIAKIIDKENVYKVPKKTNSVVSRIQIDIPADAPLGTEWTVRFKAGEVASVSGDMVQIVTGLSDSFKVRVGPLPEEKPVEEEKPETNMWLVGGAAVLLAAGASLASYKLKKRRKK